MTTTNPTKSSVNPKEKLQETSATQHDIPDGNSYWGILLAEIPGLLNDGEPVFHMRGTLLKKPQPKAN